jgi:hypothetical protein
MRRVTLTIRLDVDTDRTLGPDVLARMQRAAEDAAGAALPEGMGAMTANGEMSISGPKGIERRTHLNRREPPHMPPPPSPALEG